VHPSLCFPATSLARLCKADDDHSSFAEVSNLSMRKLATWNINNIGGDGETRRKDVLRGRRTTLLTEKFAAGQTSRRQHGSQKRLGAVRHQVTLSALHGHLRHLHCPLFFKALSFESAIYPCGKSANVRPQTHTYTYQEDNSMAPSLLERVNVPPPGCQSMGSGGPGLEK
jgi:hypothetical protein